MSKVGEILKQSRENLGYDYDKVTGDIRLSADIIELIEDGGFTKLPSYNHAKNFVKNYSEYLGLNSDEMLELLSEECKKTDFSHEPITVATEETLEEVVKSDKSGGSKFLIIVLFLIIAGIAAFLFIKSGNHDRKSADAVPAQNVEQQAEQGKPEPDDNEFNTVDKKIIEETITTVNTPDDAAAQQKSADTANAAAAENSKMPAVGDDKVAAAGTEEVKNTNGLKKAILNFSDVCWVHFKSDTGEELDFIADRANQREITFKNHFVLDIGNAAVASVSYEGKVMSGFGGYKMPVKGLKFEPNPENGGLKYSIVK